MAIEDNYIYGFIAIAFNKSGNELYALNVLPEHQNQGIGSALLETVLNEFGENLLLQIATYNEAAKRLYERYDFKKTGAHGVLQLPGGKTIPTMHMQRSARNETSSKMGTLATRQQLAKKSGVRESTIKWYTEQGLLPYTQRDTKRRRYYHVDEALQRLQYIQQLQGQGLSLEAIREKLQ